MMTHGVLVEDARSCCLRCPSAVARTAPLAGYGLQHDPYAVEYCGRLRGYSAYDAYVYAYVPGGGWRIGPTAVVSNIAHMSGAGYRPGCESWDPGAGGTRVAAVGLAARGSDRSTATVHITPMYGLSWITPVGAMLAHSWT
jgi:hypothetical protein